MSVAKQFYQLQEIDLTIESNQRSLSQALGQLGESEALDQARAKLAAGQQHLAELSHQQRSVEWEIDDLSGKIKAAEGKLYGGRIGNPKELTSLQHDVEALKVRRRQLEDSVLEMMGETEKAEAGLSVINGEIKTLEVEWQARQRQLTAEIEQLKTRLSELDQKRKKLAGEIEPQAIEFYSLLRKNKGIAVAKVEQGVCCSCRISLPTAELQRTRDGSQVQCGNCGRILYLA